jgi:phosphotransferase system IIA component
MLFFQAGIVKYVVSFVQAVRQPVFLASRMGSGVRVKQNANPFLQPTRG